jgi:hypothetical protein
MIPTFFPSLRPYLCSTDLYSLCHVSTPIRHQITTLHPSFQYFVGEHIIRYNTKHIPFRHAVFQSLFGTEAIEDCSPDKLHALLPPEPSNWKRKGTLGNERWLRNISSKLWKQSGGHKSKEIMHVYTTFMLKVIAPLMREAGETTMYYSKIPLLRTHFPCPGCPTSSSSSSSSNSSNSSSSSHGNTTSSTTTTSTSTSTVTVTGTVTGTGTKQSRRRGIKNPGVSTQRHTDGSYGHPSSEFNIWLPLNNRVWGTNSLYRDTNPWSGEESATPFELEYGDFVIFYGNQTPHQTKPNKTGITRCSIDCRVIPGSLMDDTGSRTYHRDGPYFTKLQL